MKVEIKVKSPVHIGSGETYNNSEYITGRAKKNDETVNIIKRIDVSKYFLSLDADKQDEFIHSLSSSISLENFDDKIKGFERYKAIIKSENNIKKVNECIKTLNKIYIPGSSLKGSIRTALLYNSLDFEDIESVKKYGNLNFKKFNKKFNILLRRKFTSSQVRNSAQGDVLKFLQVTDSTILRKVPRIYEVLPLMAKTVNGRNLKDLRVNKTSYLETIDIGSKLKCDIKINYNKNIHSGLNFGDKLKMLDIEHIKKSLFLFSKAFIDHEIEFSEKYDIDYLSKFYNKLEKINSIDSPLSKLGSGSGFLATTIVLKVKNQDEELYDSLRNSLKSRTYNYEFPKSRKITKINGNPLGWIQLTFEE